MNENIPYKEGTIKLTWIKPDDYWVLESKMFKSPNEAIEYAIRTKRVDWLLFKLVWTDGGSYRWELPPNGAYRSYTTGMKISDNVAIKAILHRPLRLTLNV